LGSISSFYASLKNVVFKQRLFKVVRRITEFSIGSNKRPLKGENREIGEGKDKTYRIPQWAANVTQTFLSFTSNFGGLLAGTVLAVYFNVFSVAPWSLALYPGILSIRGSIGGLFCGRLSTSLHLGTVQPSFRGNTKEFKNIVQAVTIIALESSIVLSTTSSLAGILFRGITFADVFDIFAVTTSTMALSLIVISPVTIGVSILSFKHGLDPDIVVYPVISTSADILESVCYVLSLVSFFVWAPLGTYILLTVDLAFLVVVLYILKRKHKEKDIVKTVREFTLTLVLVSFIVNGTGGALDRISKAIGERPEVYMVYPAMIDTVGDVGSVIGSTATTKLALGTLSSSFHSIKKHLSVILSAWLVSAVMFVIYSLISSLTFATIHTNYISYVLQLLTTNFMSVACVSMISYTVAIITFRRGLNPDNFVIPLESSMADAITTVSLLVAMTVIA